MTSTTLITFLLCTSPDVRKVELLGSWDNFNRAYPMERDKRTGAGHWRGCHTFTDIICDGDSQNMSPGRSGGLKMGGTYWYYYRVDGDIESYNDAEPITTLCPLLPGQPVNVLNVPIALPTTNTHSRDVSIDSTRSEMRTMDPQDKYLNPRTPPRPKLTRLKTSPPLYQHANPSWSSLLAGPLNSARNRSVSQPTSALPGPGPRLMPKEKTARSVSPPRNRGLRAAIKQLAAARSPGSEGERDQPIDTWTDNNPSSSHSAAYLELPRSKLDSAGPASNLNSPLTSPTGSIDIDRSVGSLPFRRPELERDHQIARPLWSRRASRTGYREPSPLRSQSSAGSPVEEGNMNGLITFSQLRTLETLEEALSQQNTPMPFDNMEIPQTSHQRTPKIFNNEKRLPTLPNTPSSILDSELRAMDAQNHIDEELLRSHFSDYTSVAFSDKYVHSTWEKSRFSEWSTDTEMISPASMTSESTFNCENTAQPSPIDGTEALSRLLPVSVHQSSQPTTPTMNEGPAIFPESTFPTRSPVLSPSFSTDPNDLAMSALTIDALEDVERGPKRRAAMFGEIEALDSFGSPFDEPGPPWKAQTIRDHGASNGTRALLKTREEIEPIKRQQSLGQSAAMKELMDELSYLGDIIKAGL